jgi:hypothetical protein
MTLQEHIRRAEQILPGKAARDGEQDARWQAIIDIGEFVEHEPQAVWDFVRRWGSHPDADLRDAIATCLIEHLLEHHFDLILPKIEEAARVDPEFAETVQRCWAFGQAKSPDNAKRLATVLKRVKRRGG